jgi:hypothetical protein
MTRILGPDALQGDLRTQIEELGRELRPALWSILESVAGPQPRPTRVARALALDKSLASRLVRAAQADTDLELMHIVPSPAGLNILAHSAARVADPGAIEDLRAATERFQALLDTVPGGRAAIDAQISESSYAVREKSEQIAKQASFKSMSFLLGQFCDTLATSLFLVPSANGRTVDGIEISRRIGLRRMRPSTPLALLSFHIAPEDDRPGDSIQFVPIDDTAAPGPTAFLLPDFSTRPLPDLEVMREGSITTLVLPPDPTVNAPAQLTSAFRIRNAWLKEPENPVQSLRGYVLHVPARRLVRDVFVAEGLYPGATPRVSFVLPGPRASTPPPNDSGPRHFTTLDLATSIEQLPAAPLAYALPGVRDHAAATAHVLARAGHASTRFRGWRCAVTYPVPLIEMIWWLSHPGLEPRK